MVLQSVGPCLSVTPTTKLGGVSPPQDAVRVGIQALADIEGAMSDEDVAVLRGKIRAQKEKRDGALAEVHACLRESLGFFSTVLCPYQLHMRRA